MNTGFCQKIPSPAWPELRADAAINVVARTLKQICTPKVDYWIKQWFSSIASIFKMGTSIKEKNVLLEGANSFP